eukprot:GHVU01068991.1.p1 GENE.GHVU01068991.1~~GHVU01068991.1.p1  ORF type:complete len:161 (-),score=3.99 GHVU01068991.1:568-1050(-)
MPEATSASGRLLFFPQFRSSLYANTISAKSSRTRYSHTIIAANAASLHDCVGANGSVGDPDGPRGSPGHPRFLAELGGPDASIWKQMLGDVATMYVCRCLHVYVCRCLHVCVSLPACVCVSLPACVCVSLRACMSVATCVYVDACMFVCSCLHVCGRVYG